MDVRGLQSMARTLGRGIGQIMFQNNALSGAIMLFAIAWTSWSAALLTLLCTVVSTVTARVFRYDIQETEDGLYGFNGALVGIAAGVFLMLSWQTVALACAAAALSTGIARFFRYQSLLKGYTMPFVLATWFVIQGSQFFLPHLQFYPTATDAIHAPVYTQAFFLSVGQVMFQATWVAGALFLIAIAMNSRLNALYAVFAAFLCLFAVVVHGEDYSTFNLGLFGYNAVLCAIALGDRRLASLLAVIAAILLSVMLQMLGMRLAFTTLTAPFVIATWVVEILWTYTKNTPPSMNSPTQAATVTQAST